MYDDKGRFQSVDDAEDWSEEVSEASRYRKLYETFKKEGDYRTNYSLGLLRVEQYLLEVVAHHKRLAQTESLRLLLYDEYCRIVEEEKESEAINEFSRYQKLYETFKKEGDRSRSFPLALSSVERSMLELVAYHKNLNQSQTLRLLLYDAYNRIVEEERGEDF